MNTPATQSNEKMKHKLTEQLKSFMQCFEQLETNIADLLENRLFPEAMVALSMDCSIVKKQLNLTVTCINKLILAELNKMVLEAQQKEAETQQPKTKTQAFCCSSFRNITV